MLVYACWTIVTVIINDNANCVMKSLYTRSWKGYFHMYRN